MIASIRPVCAPDWHGVFLAMVPSIRRCAEVAFADLRGDHRDDAIQEVLANACVAFARLLERGLGNKAFATVLARFAIAQVRAGRRVGTPLNCRDVLSEHARRRNHFKVERLDRFDTTNASWTEAVVEDHHTPVFDQVAFRIDFPEWLSRLSGRNRRIAETLAEGATTQEVAARFGISAGRVSQLRRELHGSWRNFRGEPTAPEATRSSETRNRESRNDRRQLARS
jgi:hypothetical protein